MLHCDRNQPPMKTAVAHPYSHSSSFGDNPCERTKKTTPVVSLVSQETNEKDKVPAKRIHKNYQASIVNQTREQQLWKAHLEDNSAQSYVTVKEMKTPYTKTLEWDRDFDDDYNRFDEDGVTTTSAITLVDEVTIPTTSYHQEDKDKTFVVLFEQQQAAAEAMEEKIQAYEDKLLMALSHVDLDQLDLEKWETDAYNDSFLFCWDDHENLISRNSSRRSLQQKDILDTVALQLQSDLRDLLKEGIFGEHDSVECCREH